MPTSPLPSAVKEKVVSPVALQKQMEPSAEVVKMEVEDADETTMQIKEVQDGLESFRVVEESWKASQEMEDDDVKVEVKMGTEPFYVISANEQNAIRMFWIDAYEDVHKANGISEKSVISEIIQL